MESGLQQFTILMPVANLLQQIISDLVRNKKALPHLTGQGFLEQ
jgi:hypothetical protein